MANEQAPIIKKVKKVSGHGHHGGAWKVAYADFVTAMMAFFLLMWLLSSTSEEQRKGIADFFSPSVPVSDTSSGGRAMFNGEVVFSSQSAMSKGTGGASKGDDDTERVEDDPDGGLPPVVENQEMREEAAENIFENTEEMEKIAFAEAAERGDGAEAFERKGQSEIEDPELAELAEDLAEKASTALAEETARADAERAAETGEGETGAGVEMETADAADVGSGEADKPGQPTTIDDVAKLDDQTLLAAEREKRERDIRAVEAAFEALKEENQGSELLEHLTIKLTPEGLMIEISEVDGRPLFEKGSSAPTEILRALIEVVAPIIAQVENEIALVGHTDATPYRPGSASNNWRLSAERADAARIILLEQALPEARIQRITGAAAREPLSEDPFAPANRRIGITLLREPASRSPAATE